MDIGKSLQQSWDLYIKNFGTLFLANLIAGILSIISIGILAGPLSGGMLVLCLKLRRGEPTGINEIFAHFDQFRATLPVILILWAVVLAAWIMSMIPFIGWIVDIGFSPMAGLVGFLMMGFIVDQKMKPAEAFDRSIDCWAAEPLLLWIYSLIMMILAGVGMCLLFIPVILTLPLGVIGLSIAYQQISTHETPPFKEKKQVLRVAGTVVAVLIVTSLIVIICGSGKPFYGIPVEIRR